MVKGRNTDHSEKGYVKKVIISIIICFVIYTASSQNPPTILRSSVPPDISEQYRANPRFYEVMSAFPHPNSYTRFDFDEVRKAARNDPEMMVILGDHYRIGRSTPLDFKKALREYQKAASRGYAKADHRIAYMYADGLGLPKETSKILEHLRISADGGYVLAQYDYALVYLNGKFDEPRDFGKAYRYLDMASKQGHKLSTELLAMLAIHPGSVNAGIPYGFATSVRLYKKAGDTDGERALRQNISTYGGLRYYLRALPGFLEGVDYEAEPSIPDQGFLIIKQLQQHRSLLGDELTNTYREEIAENILYKAYFAAQGNRKELLRFIILCHKHEEWLSPYNQKYIEAASRDFRLSVQYSDRSSLNRFFEEFSEYPRTFSENELPYVADRVFVALFLKEADEDLKSEVINYLNREKWILKNLSNRYIAYFETDQFLKNRALLIEQPYIATVYLDELFSRYNIYRVNETDTLAKGLVPGLRTYCLHPYLSDKMIKGIGSLRTIQAPIQDILKGMKEAAMIYLTDINRYFKTLDRDPHGLLFANADIQATKKIAASVYRLMQETGARRLDTLCSLLPEDPALLLSRIESCNIYHLLEMETGTNIDRLQQLNVDLWTETLGIVQLSCADPNGVAFSPQTTERALSNIVECSTKPQHILVIHQSAGIISEINFMIINRSSEPVAIKLSLINSVCEGLPEGQIPPDENVAGAEYINSEIHRIQPGETIPVTIRIPPDKGSFSWVPVFRVINHKHSVFAQKRV